MIFSNITDQFDSSIMDDIIFIFYTVDIFLNFNTAVYVKGNIVFDRWVIAKAYLKVWFWIDLISTFPFYLMIEEFTFFSRLRLLRLLR